MSREIKFRLWDKDLGMDYNPKLGPANNDLNNQFAMALGEIMQFTGLYDKNGKEIYEGDIVETETSTGNHRFSIEYNEEKGGYLCPHIVDDEYETFIGQLPNSIEVIGNIYENPTLLDNKD